MSLNIDKEMDVVYGFDSRFGVERLRVTETEFGPRICLKTHLDHGFFGAWTYLVFSGDYPPMDITRRKSHN